MKFPAQTKPLRTALQGVLMASLSATSTITLAAPWSLVNQPLYLTSKVPANVLLLVDDSGSMDWEIMSKDLLHDGLFTGTQPDGSNPPGSGKIVGSCGAYSYGVDAVSSNIGSCDLAEDLEWRFRNSNYNPFYFDPLKTYSPWPGFNSDGVTPLGDMDVHKALANPWIGWRAKNNGNEAIDLTTYHKGALRYYTWTDNDKDGLFDNGEETEHLVASAPAAVQKNFANWFSYYRSRHLIAKSAFGRLLASSSVNGLRVGLATLHNNGNVNTPISQVDTTPTGEANRKNLLSHLYQVDPGQGTPLQLTLKQAGEYLSGHTSNTLFKGNTAAPLTEAQGGSCQQNFTLLMTDGFYNGTYDDNSPVIGNADGDNNKPPFDGGTYGDAYSKTLGDIAMYYYENDIVPSVPNKVPTLAGVDEATHQHMVTFTVAFGVSGNLKGMPEDYTSHPGDVTWNNGKFPGWPKPSSGTTSDKFTDPQRIDDLRHAAYNGRGEFLEANDPDSLVNSLTQVFNSIQNHIGSSSAAAFNATSLQKGALVFQAGYDTSTWEGKLLYRPVGNTGVIGAGIVDAGVALSKTVASARTVMTTHSAAAHLGIPFRWANLAADQQAAVGTSLVLDYLRGDQSCEIGHAGGSCTTKNLRKRKVVLGDIINSTPVYVGAPDSSHDDDVDYAAFVKLKAGRTPVLYVGANDGMLHGFDALSTVDGSGKASAAATELLAYVPSTVYKNLAGLSSIAYSHRYFVDATPIVTDAKFADGWHSILLSGLRGGGQAMFALDVTDPVNFTDANAAKVALWEFNDVGTGTPGDKGDPDLGYTYGEPAITKMADGNWAAVFGNGYNNTEADGNASTSGDAVLYVVNLKTGELIRKIDTFMGSKDDPECLAACAANGRPNGLSGVRVIDVDADGVADFAYAGDLFGNLWRFDLTDAAPKNWTTSFTNAPLFTANYVDADPKKPTKMQSITVRPTVGVHPLGIEKGYMVYFGTGKFLEMADNSTVGQTTQSFYAVWDQWPKGGASKFAKIERITLQAQTILEETLGLRITSNDTINWKTKQGWYMDLMVSGAPSNNGERVLYEALLRNGQVLFSTFVPGTAVCDAGGGGFVMIASAASGARPGVPPLDRNRDGSINADDMLTYGTGKTSAAVTGYKSSHGIPTVPVFIEGAGGASDYVGVAFSDGYIGGIVNDPTPEPPLAATSLNQYDSGIVQGRVTWKRLK